MVSLARIPPVTMEDLNAFQARHFIGSSNIPARHDENVDDGDDGDDDRLGYYDDGVKRTLTDQEIEIFRHSEIQSILRKRRIKEEDRLEKMRDDISVNAENSDFGAGTTSLAQENRQTDKVGNQLGLSESKNGGGEFLEGSRKKTKQLADSGTASTITLDYGGDTSTSVEFGTSSAQQHVSFMGRKMVSYGDDDADI